VIEDQGSPRYRGSDDREARQHAYASHDYP